MRTSSLGSRIAALTLVAVLSHALASCGGDDGATDAATNQNQSTALCGNGVIEGSEVCDDGAENSDVAPDACRTDCTASRCGDSVVDASERCDDGPRNSDVVPDACRRGCVPAACGDGVVDVARDETCDPPGGTCGVDCQVMFCGNGTLDGTEVCDDGNNLGGDGCSPDCRSDESCGNGRVDAVVGEMCDCGADEASRPDGCAAPNGDPAGPCTEACLSRYCGNGVTDPGEVCDDGNLGSGDGCSPDCLSDESCGNGRVDAVVGETCDCGADEASRPAHCAARNGDPASPCTDDCRSRYCGNGELDPGEVCDDGNLGSGDGCSPDCLSDESCGNGIADYAAGEECDCGDDPAHPAAGCAAANGPGPAGSCRADCVVSRCGNGHLDPDEVCDDGNNAGGDGCAPDCRSDETCGNGVVDVARGEQCDDGNGTSGDGCDDRCRVEFCGNGVVDASEVCDDGNLVAGDGCAPGCRSDERCGNGITDVGPGEECDCGDGTVPLPAGCTAPNGYGPAGRCRPDCQVARCGNGVLDPGEVCDDGDNLSGDGCSGDCQSLETCGNGYVDFPRGEQCDDGNRRSHDGCSSGCTVETPLWQELIVDRFLARHWVKTAYDPVRERTVAFGGQPVGAWEDDQTWEYDGTNWELRAPAHTPGTQTDSPLVFHPGRGTVVVLVRTLIAWPQWDMVLWEYDGVDWRVVSTTSPPPGRLAASLVYDTARDRLVLFGGVAEGTWELLDDTWELDGTTWVQRTPAVAPPGRDLPAMVYDVAGQRTVLFGGWGPGQVTLTDTWAWDGTSWSQLGTTVPFPCDGPRRLVYDGTHDRVTLINRRDDPLQTTVWTLSGAQWVQLPLSGTAPSMSIGAALADDTARGVLVLVTGSTSPGSTALTYEIDGSRWTNVSPPHWPPVVPGSGMACNPLTGEALLVGGLGSDHHAWRFSGNHWWRQRLPPTILDVSLSPLVFDRQRQRWVRFGGYYPDNHLSAQTQEYDGSTWTVVETTHAPTARSHHGLAYDERRGVVVLYGGSEGGLADGDTWEYDGTDWTAVTPVSSPPSCYRPALTFDRGRGVVVALILDQTWEYNGVTWRRNATAGSPGWVEYAPLTYDEARGRVLLFGGQEHSGALDVTWEYDGATWTRAATTVAPEARYQHGLCHDPVGRRTLLYGGSPPHDGTWVFRYTSPHAEERCANGTDDDADGLVDCQDLDCAAYPGCGREVACTDGTDDDGDGLVDCADPDCAGAVGCRPEVCGNGGDDDGDGDVDCGDFDCLAAPGCAP
jgi:cysteine-rich repeat protein